MKKVKKAIWKVQGCQKGIPDAETIANAVSAVVWGVTDYRKVPEVLYDEDFDCSPVVKENENLIIFKTVSGRIIQISKRKPQVRFFAPRGSFCLFHQLDKILTGLILNSEVSEVKFGDSVDERTVRELFSIAFGPYMTNYKGQLLAGKVLQEWFDKASLTG